MQRILIINIRLLNNRFNINNRKSALISTLFAFVELQYIERNKIKNIVKK